MVSNIGVLLTGILQNPGIPQSIIDKLLKDQLGKSSQNTSINEDDIENAPPPT